MSYLSMIAATPCRELPSSIRCSTRTTLPDALTSTSSPLVISLGNVSMISNAEPAFTSRSITKYKPRVEISRVFPLWVSAYPCAGTLTMIGNDKSYRRAPRRSDIAPIHHQSSRVPMLPTAILSLRVCQRIALMTISEYFLMRSSCSYNQQPSAPTISFLIVLAGCFCIRVTFRSFLLASQITLLCQAGLVVFSASVSRKHRYKNPSIRCWRLEPLPSL
jgi:hypothetical protein